MAVDEIEILSPTFSSSGSFETLWSAILGLPLLELVAICANLTLSLLFLFVVSARKVLVCVGRGVRFGKENITGNASPGCVSVDLETRDVVRIEYL